MQENTTHVSGFVNGIVFESETSGYKVLEIASEDGLELYTAVGTMPDVELGEKLDMVGKWVSHSTYGEQFSVSEYRRSIPDDEDSMERYLGSGVIKGIGEALAHRMVEAFGKDTFRIIEEEPERLSLVKGISDRKAIEIAEQFVEKAASREAMIYLSTLGLTPTMSMKVYKAFGSRTIQMVQANPYLMAEKVSGISFRRADEIARLAGLPMESPARIKSAIRFVLASASGEGHTFLPYSKLEEALYELIGLSGELVENAYEEALMNGMIVRKEGDGEDDVYLRSFFVAETGTARKMTELLALATSVGDFRIKDRIRQIETSQKIHLSEEQLEAVVAAYTNGVTVITGGPGTGKTTIIKILLALLDQDGGRFALAAPTGKAAKRMEEATGREARTIHRLLEVQSVEEDALEGRMHFHRNEEHPLEYDVIIVDEMSMVDISLMYHLMQAIPGGTRLILLGDQDQLPSVGAGNVLKDLIKSEVLPVVRLTHIYRQKGQSSIVINAHRINEGKSPVYDNQSSDFFIMRRSSVPKVVEDLTQVVKTRFPKYAHVDPVRDIQVLTPMKKGPLGAVSLNMILQEALNPPHRSKKEVKSGDYTLRVGDKVMQIRNNYEMVWEIPNRFGMTIDEGKGVFNGDTGRIEAITLDGVKVQFEGGRVVTYDVSELSQLELSYAMTIHKSQGTESPVVVLPLLGGPGVLLTRNLLYTAVTRAKQYVVIIGSEETVEKMVDNNLQAVRYSNLAGRLKALNGHLDLSVDEITLPAQGLSAEEMMLEQGLSDDLALSIQGLSADDRTLPAQKIIMDEFSLPTGEIPADFDLDSILKEMEDA